MMQESPKILLSDLEKAIHLLPGPMYLKNLNSVYLSINQSGLEASGLSSHTEIIGKSDYELWPEHASQIVEHDREIINTKKPLINKEESVLQPDGTIKYFYVIKIPVLDDSNNVIGIVGNSVDITDRKEKERLQIENEKHEAQAQEHEKFRKSAEQLAHDINSPLASLKMLAEVCVELPEEYRLMLRQATSRIQDIASELLRSYKSKGEEHSTRSPQPTLVSALLTEILSEKRTQYKNLDIEFSIDFNGESGFSFIKTDQVAFGRMLSNIINNSVDSIEKPQGKIDIKLNISQEKVRINIKDNGKGMPKSIIDKIMSHIPVTMGKEHGHGIGFGQIMDTLNNNQGTLSIDSQENLGTLITVEFPRIKAPSWIIDKIELNEKDVVIILDDDPSIHGAWKARFSVVLKDFSNLEIKHFTDGAEMLEFVKSFSAEEKENIFLLSDYELLNQEMQGLQIIKTSVIKRSILVTSHYNKKDIQEEALNIGTKILPKTLASIVPIIVNKSKGTTIHFEIEEYITNANALASKIVDGVIVDDDQIFANNLIRFIFKDSSIDAYYTPEHFLSQFMQYPKDTLIILDNNFKGSKLTGINIGEKLYSLGYTNLYLLTGELNLANFPPYLTVLQKTDLTGIKKYLAPKSKT